MATRRTPPTDLTGTKAAQLRKEAEQDVKDRSNEIAMATVAKQKALDETVLDLTGHPELPVLVDEVTELVEDAEEYRLIRVVDDLPEVTIGDRTYDFEAGQQYKVPPNVEFVLREAGRLYLRA